MKPLLVSSGEPAGIGPELCLALAGAKVPLVVLGDKELLKQRAKDLNLTLNFIDYEPNKPLLVKNNSLTVWSLATAVPVVAGQLNVLNAPYVLSLLTKAVDSCLQGEFSALVTAPVHKAIINQAGFDFTGHTEFLQQRCQAKEVVMMLASTKMKVALVTTHLPLGKVPAALTAAKLTSVLEIVDAALRRDFALQQPKLYVAGLNPHAGEEGYLGREELDLMQPVLTKLRAKGLHLVGPLPADTMFSQENLAKADVFISMYHDQGLAVLKYASFGEAVNLSLGLPLIRTSVDHGTALELAGRGLARADSLKLAVNLAAEMVEKRANHANP